MYVEDSFIKSVERQPLDWQKAGLQFTASGYGSKIPTELVLKCADGRQRRVYATCYSNCPSLWVNVGGLKRFLHDYQLEVIH